MDSRIKLLCEYTRGPTVLDLGAVQHDAAAANGDNWLHEHLCQRFERVIGVDILADAVAELRARGYDMRHADVETLDLDVTADTVVAGELIEHLANPGRMLARAHDHLRPGGRLVLSTPNPWALVHLRRLATGHHDINDEHCAWFGPQTLRQLLARQGFFVEQLHTTNQDHKGLTGLAQKVGSEIFGGTTWICVARKVM